MLAFSRIQMEKTEMNRLLKSTALAIGISLIGGAALACGPDGCGKGKDGKMECCCDKMKDSKTAVPKPDAPKPAQPDPHAEHKH